MLPPGVSYNSSGLKRKRLVQIGCSLSRTGHPPIWVQQAMTFFFFYRSPRRSFYPARGGGLLVCSPALPGTDHCSVLNACPWADSGRWSGQGAHRARGDRCCDYGRFEPERHLRRCFRGGSARPQDSSEVSFF